MSVYTIIVCILIKVFNYVFKILIIDSIKDTFLKYNEKSNFFRDKFCYILFLLYLKGGIYKLNVLSYQYLILLNCNKSV